MAITAAELQVKISAQGAGQTKSQIDSVGASVDRAGARTQALGRGLVAIGAGMVGTLGGAVMMAANFEQGMDGVAASLGGVDTAGGITTKTFKALQEEALRIGSTTSKSAIESAQAMELMAKAGVDVETILNQGAQAAVNISEATGEGLQQSAETMSSLMLLFKDTGIGATEMSDVIVNGMNASSATMSEFQTGMARLAPTIVGTDMSMQDAAASIAYFNAQGFSAAEVGTSLNSAFTRMANPTAEASAEMERLGIAAFDANGKFVGFPALMDNVALATAGMSEEQRAAALSTIFGADALDVMTVAAEKGGKGLADYEKRMAQTGSAAQASAIRMDNLKGRWEEFTGAISEAAIRMGTPMLGPLSSLLEALTGLVTAFSNLPAPVLAAVGAIGAIAGVAALAAGGLLLLSPQIMATTAAIAKFGGMRAILRRAAMGIGRFALMAGPLGLVALAAGALYLAWRNNFLGMRDITDDFFAKAVPRFEAMNQITDPLSAGLYAVGAGLRNIGLNDAGAFFEDLARSTDRVIDGLTALFDLGSNRWRSLTGGAAEFASGLRLVMDSVNDVIFAFQQGGWSAMWSRIPEELGDAWRGIQRMNAAIGDLAVQVQDWVINVGAPTLGGWIVEVGGNIGAWIIDQLPAVGSFVMDVVGWVINVGAPTLGGWLLSVGRDIGGWIKSQIPAIQNFIVEVGGWILNVGAPTLGGWMTTVGRNISEWLHAQIMAGVGTLIVEVKSWFINLGEPELGGPGGGGNLNASIVERINSGIGSLVVDFGRWVLNLDYPEIGGAMAAGGSAIVQSIKRSFSSAGGAVVDFGAWTLNVPMPTIAGALGESFGNMVEVFRSKLPSGITVPLPSWNLNVPLPSIELPDFGGIVDSINDALPSLSVPLPSWTLSVPTPNIDMPNLGSVLSTIKNRISQYFSGSQVEALIDILAEIGNVNMPSLADIEAEITQQFQLAESAASVPVNFVADLVLSGVGELPSQEEIVTAAKAAISIMGPISVPIPIIPDFTFAASGNEVAQGGPQQLGFTNEMGGPAGGGGGGMFSGLAAQIQTELTTLTTTITTQFTIMGAQIGLAMSNLSLGISTTFTTIATNVGIALMTLGTTVSTGFTILVAQVGLAMSNLSLGISTTFTTISTNVGVAMTTLTTRISTGFTIVVARVGLAMNNMKTGVTTAMNTMATSVGTAMTTLTTRITTGFNTAVTAATTAANRITTAVSTMAGRIADEGRRAGSEFASGIRAGFDDAVGAAETAASQIVGAVQGIAGEMRAAGANAGAALAEGLRSQVGAVQAAANALAAAANASVITGMQISSPSKVWMYFGEMMGLGAVQGLESMAGPMARAAGQFASASLGTAAGTSARGLAGAGGVVNHYYVITPTPAEWERVDQDARAGGSLARSLADAARVRAQLRRDG